MEILDKLAPTMTTPELCANCGKLSQKQDDCISITLLFSRASKQVVCVEVGKDFADMLMGFLTLPLSCMVRVLAEANMIHRPNDELKTPPGSPVRAAADMKKRKFESNPHFALTSLTNIFESGENGV